MIPFLEYPPLVNSPIALTAYSEGSKEFVALSEEVSSLLNKKTTEVVEDRISKGFYSCLFLVPKSSGQWRPVLDTSALNFFIQKMKFKMETSQSVLSFIQQGNWVITLDMQDVHFHIPIHPGNT